MEVGDQKQGIRFHTTRKRSPKRLWDYLGPHVAAIRRLTAWDIPELDGLTSQECMSGATPIITAYAQFDWYDYVWYIDDPEDVASPKRKLGRWIGVAEKHGGPLCYWILPISCIPSTKDISSAYVAT